MTANDTATINITVVNDAPTATADTFWLSDATIGQIPFFVLLANDSDPDGNDHLTITSVQSPAGQVIAVDLTTVPGMISFTTNGLSGDDTSGNSFAYTITDSNGNTSTATVTVRFVIFQLVATPRHSRRPRVHTSIPSAAPI